MRNNFVITPVPDRKIPRKSSDSQGFPQIGVCGTASLNVYPRREAKKAFSCWRRCRPQAADVEGTPKTSAEVRKNTALNGHILSLKHPCNSICSVRCPLHIPPLRRGPSPAGEGFFSFPVRVYGQPGAQLLPQAPISRSDAKIPSRQIPAAGGEIFTCLPFPSGHPCG